MQVSFSQAANLIGCNGVLRGAINEVLGDKARDVAYALTQTDADCLADAIDARHRGAAAVVAAEDEAAATWAKGLGVFVMDQPVSERIYAMQTECNVAAVKARELFELAGLHTPAVWLD